MPSDELMLSYEREAWVIPNGSGALWTDRVFGSRAEAQAYIDRVWRERKWTAPKHTPARAKVRLTALLHQIEAADA